MVTSPVNATISRVLWNFSSAAQLYLEYFPQLQVRAGSCPDLGDSLPASQLSVCS